MKSISEWDQLQNNMLFNPEDMEAKTVAHIAWLGMTFMPTMLMGWGLDALFMPTGLSVAMWLGTMVVLSVVMPFAHKIHPLDRLNGVYGYYPDYNLKYRAEEYLSLTKSEREFYPKDILKQIKNDRLSPQQRHEIDSHMNKLYRQIMNRRRTEKALTVAHIDINPILDQLEQGRRYAEIDTETFKEYA